MSGFPYDREGVSGTPSTQVKRHPHVFTALYWHFGPYGRQDVHVHSCQPWDDSGDRCARVLIGPGRNCDGDRKSHWRETL